MDFVAAWKAISIAFTGAFGVLALFTENKNKETGRLTTWGRISLAGIILSTSCGVVAQLKETSDENHRREATAIQTLALVTHTGETVTDIKRLMSPLDELTFSMAFRASCDDIYYSAFCSNVRKMAPRWPKNRGTIGTMADKKVWDLWPSEGHNALLPLQLYFFRETPDLKTLASGNLDKADLRFLLVASNYAIDKSLEVNFDEDIKTLDIQFFSYKPLTSESRGKISSLLDLPGSTIILTELNNRLNGMTPTWFVIETKGGRRVDIDTAKMERITVHNQTAYRYEFVQ